MATSLQLNLFREPDPTRFRKALESVVKRNKGCIAWDAKPEPFADALALASRPGVQSLSLPYFGAFDHQVLTGLGRELGVAWIALYIQESAVWEYILYRGDEVLDQFSVAPEYWEPDDPEFWAKRRGKPELLAETWNVQVERIRDYLVHWKMYSVDKSTFDFKRKGKAYPEDRFEYGKFWQMLDFVGALGGVDPRFDETGAMQHVIHGPKGGRK